jgi:predicted nucleic acid-binding protein
MTGQRFAIDTNVLVYAVEEGAGEKGNRARQVIGQAIRCGRAVLPLQTIGEFLTTLLRKGSDRREAAERARAFSKAFLLVAADPGDVAAAIDATAARRLSYWDGLLLATAARHGCTCLLSEDMQDGARLMGVTVRNPFPGEELAPDLVALLAPAARAGAK